MPTRASQTANDRPPSPSSPPPNKPPLPQTPGIRASALQKVYTDAIHHTLRACSYPNFSACFPTPAKYASESMDLLHRDFIGRLESMCKEEFEAVCEVRGVVGTLNELDGLVVEAGRWRERAREQARASTQEGGQGQVEEPVPPHLLPPGELMAAHLAPFLGEQTERLGGQLDGLQRGNRELAGEIAEQRAVMEELVGGLEGVIRDLEGAAGEMEGEGMKGVEGELEKAAMAP